MHAILLLVVTSGLVLLQTTLGLTANVEPDANFLEEAMADGFIVATKGPTRSMTNDSINRVEIRSLFQKDSVTTQTKATGPEVLTEQTNEDSNQTNPLSPEENAEGSGNLVSGSGMFSGTFDEKQDKEPQFTTTVHKSGDLKTSTLSSEENGASRMGLTTTPTISVDDAVNVGIVNNPTLDKPVDKSGPELKENVFFQPNPRLFKEFVNESDARVKKGTPAWLLILALCLTVGAVICVFVGIATKDKWYGPRKQCLNINSKESKKHEDYDKASTLPMSEKEIAALMGLQKAEKKETDFTIISLEEVPEKECLM